MYLVREHRQKRRSYAVILDHLIPSLMQSGTYDEMETLDELLKQYYHGKNGGQWKINLYTGTNS